MSKYDCFCFVFFCRCSKKIRSENIFHLPIIRHQKEKKKKKKNNKKNESKKEKSTEELAQ